MRVVRSGDGLHRDEQGRVVGLCELMQRNPGAYDAWFAELKSRPGAPSFAYLQSQRALFLAETDEPAEQDSTEITPMEQTPANVA